MSKTARRFHEPEAHYKDPVKWGKCVHGQYDLSIGCAECAEEEEAQELDWDEDEYLGPCGDCVQWDCPGV
jgi:hypothetical protein